jgi:hypothetical protein
MALEKKKFTGGLNSDHEDRLVANGDYRYALNVRASKSDGANEGAIENTKGNTLVSVDLPTGDNKVIGALDNAINNTVVYFVYNSFNNHSIYEFDVSSNTIVALLQDSLLNFRSDKLIVDPFFINDILFFNDRFNDPRSINVTRARNNDYPTPFQSNFLTVIVNAPGHPAEVMFGDDDSVTVNNVRGKLFQVRYKWVYLDNEESAWSPISKVALPVQEALFRPIGYYPLTINNHINIKYQLGGDYVKRVKIAVREGNDGDFFLADDIDKSLLNLGNSTPFTHEYKFYNDEVYTSVDNDGNSGMRLYDNVPQKADSMSQIDGNKVSFGGVTENYDPVDIDMDVQVNLDKSTVSEPPAFSQPLKDQYYNQIGINQNNFRFPSTSPVGVRFFNGVPYSFLGGQRQDYRTIPGNPGSSPFWATNGVQSILAQYPSLQTSGVGWVNSLLNSSFTVGSTSNPRDRALYFLNQNTDGVIRAGGSVINEIIVEPPESEGVRYVVTIDLRYYNVGNGDASKEKDLTIQYVSVAGDTAFSVVTALKAELVSKGVINEQLVDIRFDHSEALPGGSWFYGFGGGNVDPNNALLRIYGEAYIPADDKSDGSPSWPTATGGDTGVVYYMNSEISTYSSWTLKNEKTLKSGAVHGVGLVYYDEPNRSGLTNVSQEKKFMVPFFSDPSRDLQPNEVPNDTTLTLTIKHNPPSWAKRYQVVYTGNQTVEYIPGVTGYKGFVQFLLTNVAAAVTVGAKQASVSILKTYSDSVPEDIDLQYSFSPGDRIRFITKPILNSLTTIEYLQEYRDVEIISFDSTTQIVEFKDPDITIMDNQLVEIYTPKKNVDEVVYREIGEVYDIVDGFHLGNNQDQTSSDDAIIDLRDIGDVYLRYRTSPMFSVVEDYAYSDYYSSDVWDEGRPNKVDNNINQVKRISTIRYSNNYVPETNINGLSQFNDFAFEEYDQQYGNIERLYSEDKDLLVLQERKVGKVRIGQTTLYGNDGTVISTLKAQDKVLSDIVYYAGEFGIGNNPESFAVYGLRKYFTDVKRGAVLRLSSDGLTQISEIAMHNYFNDTFKDIVDSNGLYKIFGEYDVRFGEYVISIQGDITDGEDVKSNLKETLSFSEIKKRWVTFYSYIPEYLVSNNVGLISFDKGRLYKHNDNSTYNNFYGEQYTMKLRFLSNTDPSVIKVYNSFLTESTHKFAMPKAVNQFGQETSLIEDDFSDDEGVFKSNFLKDANTPNVDLPLIEGDDIRCHSLEISIENSNTEEVKIFAAGINITTSQLTNR